MNSVRTRPLRVVLLAIAVASGSSGALAQSPSPTPSMSPAAVGGAAQGSSVAPPPAPPVATSGPTAPPTPTLDMTDALTNDVDFLKEAGDAAKAAMDANDAADLAARIANDFANLQQVVGSIKGDALNGPLGDIPQIPPDRPDPDAPPAKDGLSGPGTDANADATADQRAAAADLSTIVSHSSNAASGVASHLSSGSTDMKTCAGLHDAREHLLAAATLVDDAGGAPIEAVLDYIKSVSAKQGATASVSIDAAVSAKLAGELAVGLKAKNDLDDALLVEAANSANDEFDKTCGTFAGPFDATMEAHFFAKDGGEWWSYTTHVHGTLSLSYARNDTGPNVPVTGEFTGGATQFTYATDPYVHLSLTKGAIVKKDDEAPVPDPEGVATTFEIPVTGTLSGTSLVLALGDSISDFDPQYVVGTTNAIIASPLAIGPVRNHYTLPYKDAHFMLQHFFRGTPWQVSSNGSSREVSFQGSLDRPNANTKATYGLNVRACDPACTSAP